MSKTKDDDAAPTNMPFDLIDKIYEHLAGRDLARRRVVSRAWNTGESHLKVDRRQVILAKIGVEQLAKSIEDSLDWLADATTNLKLDRDITCVRSVTLLERSKVAQTIVYQRGFPIDGDSYLLTYGQSKFSQSLPRCQTAASLRRHFENKNATEMVRVERWIHEKSVSVYRRGEWYRCGVSENHGEL